MANSKVIGVRIDRALALNLKILDMNIAEIVRDALELKVQEKRESCGLCPCCGQKLPSKGKKK